MADLAAATRIDTPEDWRDALRRAQDGDPYRLAYLVKHCRDSMPDDIAAGLANFLVDPVPPKRRTRGPAVPEWRAREARKLFRALTRFKSPPRLPMAEKDAIDVIAKALNVSWSTAYDIIKQRKTYALKVFDWDLEIQGEFLQFSKKKR